MKQAGGHGRAERRGDTGWEGVTEVKKCEEQNGQNLFLSLLTDADIQVITLMDSAKII